jgi:hypothetical protein
MALTGTVGTAFAGHKVVQQSLDLSVRNTLALLQFPLGLPNRSQRCVFPLDIFANGTAIRFARLRSISTASSSSWATVSGQGGC